MGYTHGKMWDDESIKKAILQVKVAYELDRMPSRKECVNYFGNGGLTNAVSKRCGGWYKLAKEMQLPIKNSETYFGKRQEGVVCEILEQMGFKVERMSQNFPYDILVNDCVKVDVKASHLFKAQTGNFYCFNLEKRCATCDAYVLITLDDTNEIEQFYIVPSVFVMHNTQISIGQYNSKYHKYKDRWDYLENISNLFASLEA